MIIYFFINSYILNFLSAGHYIIDIATKQFTQPNGRKVFVEQVGSKFNVVITEGGRAVNTFRNLSQNALDRMARNYKWR